MIEWLHAQSNSETDVVSLASQGMNIFMEMTAAQGGRKSLKLRVGAVGAAVLITDSIMENWTISVLAESSSGVGVLRQDGASICVGPARNVTASATADTQDSVK